MKPRTIERFRAKVDRRGPDECWPWTASCNQAGYGQIRIDTKLELAHRVAFFLEHGRWPEPFGLHTCDNPPCCNPAHVFDGTNADNVADKVAKGRQAKKLTHEDIRKIVEWCGRGGSQVSIARQLNISQPTVSYVVNGRRHRH